MATIEDDKSTPTFLASHGCLRKNSAWFLLLIILLAVVLLGGLWVWSCTTPYLVSQSPKLKSASTNDGAVYQWLWEMPMDTPQEVRTTPLTYEEWRAKGFTFVALSKRLLAMEEKTSDAWDRSLIAIAMGEYGESECVDKLIEMLRCDQDVVRIRAAEALGRIADERAIPALYQAASNENVNVRANAILGLGRISKKLNTEIRKGLTDRDEFVRECAQTALKMAEDGK